MVQEDQHISFMKSIKLTSTAIILDKCMYFDFSVIKWKVIIGKNGAIKNSNWLIDFLVK